MFLGNIFTMDGQMLRLNWTRLMLSTPAAIAIVASPAAIRLATIDAALSPEPQ